MSANGSRKIPFGEKRKIRLTAYRYRVLSSTLRRWRRLQILLQRESVVSGVS